jgi:tRNA pseudouridine13 synthase
MGEELTQRVHAYAQDTSTQPYILLELAMDKDTRKGIHTAIKKLFGKKLTSETVDGAIKVIPGGSAQVRDVRDKGDQWQEGDYTRFCLYKDNRDTIDAVSNLSRVLKHAFQWIVIWGRLSAKNMSYAGTKDKRGVTTQWVTAHRVAPERLARLTLRGIRVGNFSTVKKQLKLGDLQGNRFSLVIR